MLKRAGVFVLFFVAVSLLLASVVLAVPGSPAWKKTYEYEETLDVLPIHATSFAYYDELSERQERIVDRALAGGRIHVPYHRSLPPTYILYNADDAVYQFGSDSYYDTETRAGLIGIGAFVVGLSLLAAAVRIDPTKRSSLQ